MATIISTKFLITIAVLLQPANGAPLDGDEFANNLISDLAPLLSLFGEQVTKQFMSESMGWADHLIFAMVPLGIITAITGAIRVGGPGWLKAIIGRARENGAVAEVELMSSTSHEVGELWNGQQIVRTIGMPPVKDILFFSGKSESPFSSIEKAVENGNLIEIAIKEEQPEKGRPTRETAPAPNISLNLHNRIDRTEVRVVAAISVTIQAAIVVYAGFATYHPKMRYRKGDAPVEGYSFPVMAFGTFILSVGLIICAHVIEDSTTERSYRVPDQKDKRNDSPQMHGLWLQRGERVADQSFESFAIFSKGVRKTITTSERKEGWGDPLEKKGKSAFEGHPGQLYRYGVHPFTGFAAISGTLVSLFGFILQFTGLRALHWSVSLAQLCGMLILAALRAFVRRGLTRNPVVQRVPKDYELEWLATRSAGLRENWPGEPSGVGIFKTDQLFSESSQVSGDEFWSEGFWNPPGASDDVDRFDKIKETRMHLGTLTGWRSSVFSEAKSLSSAIDIVLNSLYQSPSEKIVPWPLDIPSFGGRNVTFTATRSRKKGEWKTDVFEIEAILSLWLYDATQDMRNRNLQKCLTVRECIEDQYLEGKGIWLLGNDNGLRRDLKWWSDGTLASIFLVADSENNLITPGTRPPRGPNALETIEEEDKGVSVSTVEEEEKGVSATVEEEEKEKRLSTAIKEEECPCSIQPPSGTVTVEARRIAGCRKVADLHSLVNLVTRELPAEDQPERSVKDQLAHLSDAPLALLCAQNVFSSFMKSVVTKMSGPIEGKSIVRLDEDTDLATNHSPRNNFTLQNAKLLKLARDIQRTGLGSLQDVYLCLIPALSAADRLPDASAVIESALKYSSEHYEIYDRWDHPTDIHLWLFQLGQSFDPSNIFARKATAAMVVFFRAALMAQEISEDQNVCMEGDDPPVHASSRAVDRLREALSTSRNDYGLSVLKLLSMQARTRSHLHQRELDWTPLSVEDVGGPGRITSELYDLLLEFGTVHADSYRHNVGALRSYIEEIGTLEKADILGFTPIHYAASGSQLAVNLDNCARRLIRAGAYGNVKDLAGWTPLHYNCLMGSEEVLEDLISEGLDIHARTRDGMSPLHSASIGNNGVAASRLIDAGANIQTLDSSRNTPLHLAAYYGSHEVVDILVRVGGATAVNMDGRTPGHLAALAGHYAVLEHILREPITMEEKDRFGCTMLHLAAAKGHVRVIELLVLGKGKAVNIDTHPHNQEEEFKGVTPQEPKSNDKVPHPIPSISRANIEVEDSNGCRPIHWAVANRKGEKYGCGVLLDLGADINAMDMRGRTPLDLCGLSGQLELAAYLVRGGARYDRDDAPGTMTVDLVLNKGKPEVIKTFFDGLERPQDRLFLRSIRVGNLDSIRFLVSEGANVAALDHNDSTALHIAASRKGTSEIIGLLIENGADLELRDKTGQTAMHKAVKCGDCDTVRLLIEKGANPNAQCNQGWTAMHIAAMALCGGSEEASAGEGVDLEYEQVSKKGPITLEQPRTKYLDLLRLLIENGGDLHLRDKGGEAVIHMIAEAGNSDAVSMLIEKRADLDVQNNEGQTAMHKAALSLCRGSSGVMMDEGTDPNEQGGGTKAAPAPRKKYFDVLRLLAENGANVHLKDNRGQAMIHIVAESGDGETVRMLIDKGVDPNLQNGEGQTALHRAADAGAIESLKVLVDKGANLDLQSEKGHTAIHLAVARRYMLIEHVGLESAQLLIDGGANLHVPDEGGRTVMHHASENANFNFIELLANSGADIDARDKSGQTAMHRAAVGLSSSSDTSIKFFLKSLSALVDKGADANVQDREGRTAIHYVIMSCQESTGDLLDDLIEIGRANILLKDNIGGTMLHYASYTRNETLTKRLVEKGVDLNTVDQHGYTALHLACLGGSAGFVEFLIREGANVHATVGGWTSMHLSILANRIGTDNSFYDNANVFLNLIKMDADPRSKDKYGRTAREIAVLLGLEELIWMIDLISTLSNVRLLENANQEDGGEEQDIGLKEDRDKLEQDVQEIALHLSRYRYHDSAQQTNSSISQTDLSIQFASPAD